MRLQVLIGSGPFVQTNLGSDYQELDSFNSAGIVVPIGWKIKA